MRSGRFIFPLPLVLLFLSLQVLGQDSLERGFKSPPPSARPVCFWAWMNGNISKEGITADFEAMNRIGVGGGFLFNLTVGILPGKVPVMSPEWREMMTHAAKEAARLNLEFAVHNGPGWSCSGGPWNKVEDSMQMLVMSETRIQGPAKFKGRLPQPLTRLDYYRDIATLAFKTGEDELSRPVIAAGDNKIESGKLTDGDWSTIVELPLPQPDKPQILDIAYDKPIDAQTLYIVTGPGRGSHWGEVQYSEDGKTYQTLRAFRILEYGGNNLENQFLLDRVKARHFRVRFTRPAPKAKSITLAEIGLHPDVRIDELAAKAGFVLTTTGITPSSDTATLGLKAGDVINLTNHVKDGDLTWDAPAGIWRIVRFGHTTTGSKNHPAPPEGTGLECDKMSKLALDKHWDGMMGKILADAGALAGKGITASFTDSWEAGYQNWTPGFIEEFRKRRGYDPLPYFPALTGRVVENPSVSERFLWDWRRTISDLFADNYFAHLDKLCEQHGMNYYCEPYGTNFDYMQCGGQTDMPTGECWFGRPDAHLYTIKMASSTAHIYGKKLAGSEIFTVRNVPVECGNWLNHPYQLKSFGDLKMCEGINKFVIHRYAHQPWMNLAPGMTYGECGIHFERTNTWWEEGRAWIKYLQRAQYLLQEGQFVGDVLWFTGDCTPNIPKLKSFMSPALPGGYDFDYCNVDALLKRASSRDGRIVFPDGTDYDYLLMGDNEEMSLEVANKVKDLVENGVTVIGSRPVRTPGLTGYPKADKDLAGIAVELWGKDSAKSGERGVGKGRVIWGKTFEQVFAADKRPQDFSFKGLPKVNYIHRRSGDADYYFVANEDYKPGQAVCAFRVAGKRPEFWRPDTGAIEPCPVYRESNGITEIPIYFDPAGSVFVVFRGKSDNDPIVTTSQPDGADSVLKVSEDGRATLVAFKPCRIEVARASGAKLMAQVDSVPPATQINGPWQVSFEPHRGAPDKATFEKLIPLNEHSDPGIKYFSGHATYTNVLQASKQVFGKDKRVFLDLGDVRVIAEVKLNGKDLGILWKPPYRVDITGTLKEGANKLEVRVVNLWVNRMIGDEQLPPDAEYEQTGNRMLKEWPQWLLENKPRATSERVTFTTYKHWLKNDPLQPSGLIGPVRCVVAVEKPLQ